MDFKVQNVTFGGKQEIMYGLTKAAKISKISALSNKAYTASRIGATKYEQRAAYEASMSAYTDMVINDSEFTYAVDELITHKDIKTLQDILKPITTEHGYIQPQSVFEEVLKNTANQKYIPKSIKQSVEKLNNLIKGL